ncbi:MAG: hypothetical protein OWV35_08585 [Firmicutes bacterium]|nr:hypothetical protein [Bacillota bacterium]
MATEGGDLDLSATAWQAAVQDEAALVEALAGRLEQALSGRVQVVRPRRLLGRSSLPREVRVALEAVELVLHFQPGRSIRAERARLARGVCLPCEALDLERWLQKLSRALHALAQGYEALRRHAGTVSAGIGRKGGGRMAGAGGWGYRDRAADLADGQLPADILERARRQREGGPCVSTLAAGNLWLLRRMELVRLGQAMGSAVFHTRLSTWLPGYGGSGAWTGGGWVTPMAAVEQVMRTARRHALARLQAEATGALAAVDQRLRRTGPGFYPEGGEVLALGILAGPEDGSPAGQPSLLCPGPVPNLARLLGSGVRPRGLVMGVAVRYLTSGWAQQAALRSWSNREVAGLSRALSLGRERAVEDLRCQAHSLGAEGVLTGAVERAVHPVAVDSGGGGHWTDFVVEFAVTGTAVQAGPRVLLPAVGLGLRLNGGRQ